MKDSVGFLIGCLFILIGQSITYFQNNGQFIWSNWRNHTISYAFLLSVPATLMFVLGSKYLYNSMQSFWSIKIIGFSIGILTYYVFTHFCTNEVITTKNLLCLGLAFIIILIQIFK